MAAVSAAPLAAINGAAKMASTSLAYLESSRVKETKALISELCRQFYQLGWVSGTGGSIAVRVHDESIPRQQQLIVMSPSGTAVFCVYTYLFLIISSSIWCSFFAGFFLFFGLSVSLLSEYWVFCRGAEGKNGRRWYVCVVFEWVSVVGTINKALAL